jgi:hypothetical protein
MKASQHTACCRSTTTPCASDPKNDTTRQPHRYLTPSSHSTLRRSRTSQRDTQRRHARANKRLAHNNNTATANSE